MAGSSWGAGVLPRAGRRQFIYGSHALDNKDPSSIVIRRDAKTLVFEERAINRQVVAVTLDELAPLDANLYAPDLSCPQQKMLGAAQRTCQRMPAKSRKMMRKLFKFVKRWLNNNFEPLSRDEVSSTEDSILDSKLDGPKKALYLRLYDEYLKGYHDAGREIRSFIKREFYMEPKFARIIAGVDPKFTVRYYAIFKAIEKKLFSRPEFIKKIPVPDRPRYIMEQTRSEELNLFRATDYTRFECSFDQRVMETLEIQLYKRAVSDCPELVEEMNSFIRAFSGLNRCSFGDCMYTVTATRMSGDICTSLGNGFSNLMLNLFAAHSVGAQTFGVVEGDDGLFGWEGEPPNADFFSDLGFIVKLEDVNSIGDASFCGLVFDPGACQNICDPVESLIKLPYVHQKYQGARDDYLRQLIRMKAVCRVYEAPHCPMVSVFCRRLMEVIPDKFTDRMADSEGWYYRERHITANRTTLPDFDPDPRTRILFAERYGYSLAEQRVFEEACASWFPGDPLHFEFPSMYKDLFLLQCAYQKDTIKFCEQRKPWFVYDRTSVKVERVRCEAVPGTADTYLPTLYAEFQEMPRYFLLNSGNVSCSMDGFATREELSTAQERLSESDLTKVASLTYQ
jgi:hypothetical protein